MGGGEDPVKGCSCRPRNRPRLPPGIVAPATGETGAGVVGRRCPTPTVLAGGGLPHEAEAGRAGGDWPHGAEAPALVQGTFKTWLGLSFRGAGESEVEDNPKRSSHTSGWSER
jgi:hypothetical protein